nr:hypothetical protein Iba_chr08aCG11780 [Ipomoea batatas]GMD24009.1 hypothetical protein Iba_chr08bCG10710 [Ipomoea batatas]
MSVLPELFLAFFGGGGNTMEVLMCTCLSFDILHISALTSRVFSEVLNTRVCMFQSLVNTVGSTLRSVETARRFLSTSSFKYFSAVTSNSELFPPSIRVMKPSDIHRRISFQAAISWPVGKTARTPAITTTARGNPLHFRAMLFPVSSSEGGHLSCRKTFFSNNSQLSPLLKNFSW